MDKILIAGAGKSGSALACLLASSGNYEVHLADVDFHGRDFNRMISLMPEIKTIAMDFFDENSVKQYLDKQQISVLISCLPAKLSLKTAKIAVENRLHYFDNSEVDLPIEALKDLAIQSEKAFVLHCGLVPGMVNMIAQYLINDYDHCEKVSIKVGFLPEDNSNALFINRNRSTTSIIQQYSQSYSKIENGQLVNVSALDDIEELEIDGLSYEAFNAAGGLANLLSLHEDNVKHMDYKTIHFPGHCEKMRVLFKDLKMHEDVDSLRAALKRVVPESLDDKVIISIQTEGKKQGEHINSEYVKTLYPKMIRGLKWSAAQYACAAGVSAVVDFILAQGKEYQGLVHQENLHYPSLIQNHFGCYFE
jgi:saccharopine dehydrogenase-like NADP-dependent oxidoreductase